MPECLNVAIVCSEESASSVDGSSSSPWVRHSNAAESRLTLKRSDDGHLLYTGELLVPRGFSRGMAEHWSIRVDDPHAPMAARAGLLQMLPRPADVEMREPVWWPDRGAKMDALLEGSEAEIIARAYGEGGLGWGEVRDRFTESERCAVLSVSIVELTRHAMETGWARRHLATERIRADSADYMLFEDGRYKLMHADRHASDEMFVSDTFEPVVIRYLARRHCMVRPTGADAISSTG